MSLLRVCNWNFTHERDRIMDPPFKKCGLEGITHGICDGCQRAMKKKWETYKTEHPELLAAMRWQRRKDAGLAALPQ